MHHVSELKKRLLTLALTVGCLSSVANPVSAQLAPTPSGNSTSARLIATPNNTPPAAVANILQNGQLLERSGKWGEALTLYERAQKDFGDSQEIGQRLRNARTHYDVKRRYSDRGFIRTVQKTPSHTAQNVYSEVLLKIESYYVNQPEWVGLARQGLANLDVALFDPAFRQTHLQQQTDASINYAYQRMHRIAQQYRVGNRRNAYDFAMAISAGLENDLGVPTGASMFEFINAATVSLDPYSSYLTGDQYADVMSQIDGNFVGLGVEIRPGEQTLEIVSVIPRGPADKAGLEAGDRLVSIDNKLVSKVGGEEAADLLKGPAGSLVALAVEREDTRLAFRIFRERVDIPSVQDVKIVDAANGVGLIRLVNFQKTTATDFEAALWQLHRKGMRSLIVDVRGNPGGLLTAAVDVANLFVDRGVLVSTKGRNPREDFVHQARQDGTWLQLPLTVLVDRDSASASEIFAGAIRDSRRGTIVGETSFGKGSVQGIFPLNSARGGIRLTTAKFYSPSGQAISDRGVTPDVQVQTVRRPNYQSESPQSNAGEDKFLQAGIRIAIQKNRKNAG